MSLEEAKEQMSKKDYGKLIKALKELPPPVIEKRKSCNHLHMSKVIPDDFLFVCDNCGQIIEVVGSAMYWPEQYVKKVLAVLDHIKDKILTEEEKEPEL